jgi:hypothetical protein
VGKRITPKPVEASDAPPVEETVVPPEAEPAAEPAALPEAPMPTVSLCVGCERTCKSTLMKVVICGRFQKKLRP